MLNAVQQAIVALLDDVKTERIPGLVTVQFGDAPVPTELLPAVTVDWDGKTRVRPTGSQFEVTADFAITLYAASLESEAAADQVINDLVLRAAVPKWTGVVPVLAALRGWTDDNDQSYKLQLVGEIVPFVLKKAGVYESIAVITLRVETWLDTSRF